MSASLPLDHARSKRCISHLSRATASYRFHSASSAGEMGCPVLVRICRAAAKQTTACRSSSLITLVLPNPTRHSATPCWLLASYCSAKLSQNNDCALLILPRLSVKKPNFNSTQASVRSTHVLISSPPHGMRPGQDRGAVYFETRNCLSI